MNRMKHFQIKKFMVIAAAAGFMLPGNAVFAKTAVLNGNLGEISSQINVPSKYAGYEATIIVEVERSSELGDLTSIRPLIYSVTSPSRTLYQCQANVYETSKTIAVSRTEAGVYTITGGGNTTGGTPCQGLATVQIFED